MPISKTPEKAELILKSRADMFFMSRLLAAGLPLEAFGDADTPLVVSIRGTLSAGKKIISDAMREYLMGTTAMSGLPDIAGRKGYDEYWTGRVRGGQEVELSYIDAAWLTGYSNIDLNSFATHMVSQAFMWQRTKGGIAFIQNDLSVDVFNKAGLTVWVERAGKPNVDGPDRAPDSPLAMAFRQAQQDDPANEWIRYVEVGVGDERLLKSQKFADAFQKLKRRYGGPA